MGEKKSFVLYNEYQKHIEKLSDEEAGKLFKALFTYCESGDVTELPPMADMAFSFMQTQIDKDTKKYEERCKKSRQAAKTRWKNAEYAEAEHSANADSSNAQNANACERISSNAQNADNDNEYDNDNDNTYGINTNTVQKLTKSEVDLFFDSIWRLYPVKKGKGQVKDKARKRLYDIGTDEMKRAIKRYLSELEKDTWRKPQNGSTFFNSGYIDYLDANFEPQQIRPPDIKPKVSHTADMLNESYEMIADWAKEGAEK